MKKYKVFAVLVLILFSCGINKNKYSYNEMYRLRPKENRFDTSKLKPVDYTKIDTNSIYVAADKWFYKFYGKNKVGYSRLEENLSIEESINPKRLKLGFFEIEKQKITTYILVNTGYNIALSEETALFYIDSIVNKNHFSTYKKQKLINYKHNLQPDW